MLKYGGIIGLGAVSLAVSGCASFRDSPKPVFAEKEIDVLLQQYQPGDALLRYHSTRPEDRRGMTSRQWRDLVVGIYLAGADARYSSFRTSLSLEAKGSGFGLDLAVLGLTGAGAVASGGTSNVLSAAAAGLTGTRASLSKEIYFEKTLPALVAGMDSARLAIKTQIYTKLADPNEANYPLEMALSDINAYQNAASLDGAIQQVTTDAAVKANEAQRKFDILYVAPVPIADAASLMARIKTTLHSWVQEKNTNALQAALKASGASTSSDPASDPDGAAQAVVVALAKSYDPPTLTTFMANVAASTGEAFQ